RDPCGLRQIEDHASARAGPRLDANRLDQAMSGRRFAAGEADSSVFQRDGQLARIGLRLDPIFCRRAEIEDDSRAVGMDAEANVTHVGRGRGDAREGERQPAGNKPGRYQYLEGTLLHYW